MSDQDTLLVDRTDFPISSVLGKPVNYQQVLDGDFLDLIGATGLSEEDRQKLYQKAADTIESRVLARLFDSLTEEEIEEWQQIPSEDAQALREYLEDHGINLEQMFVEEALAYKVEVVSLAKQLNLN